MAFRLIPKEERFYDDFTAMAEQIQHGAELLESMMAPDKPIWDKADEIKEVEHKCDFLTHEIIQRLNRTFVTPLDREDIHTLARSLDDVMDAIVIMKWKEILDFLEQATDRCEDVANVLEGVVVKHA